MKHFYNPVPGQTLFHYTSAEGAEAILRNQTLRLSEFSMMNDTSEYKYAKSKFVEAYQNREVWIEEAPRLIANTTLNGHERATTMMIGSVTEERDDIGLWDRYASHGKGCVLEIDPFSIEKFAGVAFRRVSYDADYLKDFVNSGLSMLQSAYEENRDDHEHLRYLASMLVFDLYAFKDPRFRSEREVRISRITVTDDTAPLNLRDVGGQGSDGKGVPALPIQQRSSPHGPIRFLEIPLTAKGHGSAIRSVGFGPNIDPERENLIKTLISGVPGIKLWKSDAPLR